MADLAKFIEYTRSFYLQRVAGYCLIVLSSLLVIIPLGTLQTRFENECLLYSEVVYEYFYGSGQRPDMVLFRIRFGPQSLCQYSLAVSALFSLIYALVMVGVYVFLFLREKENRRNYWSRTWLTGSSTTDLGQIGFVVHGVGEAVVVVLMLVSACTVSHGFNSLCSGLTDTGIAIYQVNRCADADRHNWRGYDASNFFLCLAVATVGCWFQLIFWTVQAGLVICKLRKLNVLPVLPECMKYEDDYDD